MPLISEVVSIEMIILLLRRLVLGSILVTIFGAAAAPAKADRIADLEAEVRLLHEALTRIEVELKAERQARKVATPVTRAATTSGPAPALTSVPTTPPSERSQPQASTPASAAATLSWPTGYIAVPGTDTAVKFGGAIRLEAADDIRSSQGGRTDDATAIPARGSAKANRNGSLNGSVSGSRLNFSSLSRTEIGEVKTFLEFDLGTEFSPGFRMRHAYLSTGNLLVGQTWSTFMDMDTVPDELSAGGSVGYGWLRRTQVRYSQKAGGDGRIDLAAEMPTADYTGPSVINTAPDLVVKYSADPSWGHYAIGGMLRYLRSDTGSGERADSIAWGVVGGLGIKTVGEDMLTLQTIDGSGVGAVLNQGSGLSAAVVNGTFQTFDTYGGSVAYQHHWGPKLRSTLAAGYDRFANAANNIGANGLGIRSLASLHANLIYSPIAAMDVGLEYGYESFTASPAGSGAATRLLGVVKYGY